MNILEIIEKKRDNRELSKEEIEFFIKGYTNGTIADYQAAALVMAIYLNGMTKQETTNLTLSMANSGEILDLSKLNGTKWWIISAGIIITKEAKIVFNILLKVEE